MIFWPFSKIKSLSLELDEEVKKTIRLEKKIYHLERAISMEQRRSAELLRRVRILEGQQKDK